MPRDGRRVRTTAGATAVVVVTVATLTVVRLGGDERVPGAIAATTTTVPSGAGRRPDSSAPADPGAHALRFTDVTVAAGLTSRHATADSELDGVMTMTSGVAIADIDADDDIDVYLTRTGQPAVLYRNDGGLRFTDITDAAGAGGPAGGAGAAAFADVDADGCVDLGVLGAGRGETALLMGRCDGTFDDETALRGLSLPLTDVGLGAQAHGLSTGDPDHDGDLDILALHWDLGFLSGQAGTAGLVAAGDIDTTCELNAAIRAAAEESSRNGGRPDRDPRAGPNRSRLFLNDGTGRFTDGTEAFGLHLDTVAAFTADFVDVDGDGWEDLPIAGDFCTGRLYLNDRGTRFIDVTSSAGVGTDENGMGSVVRDLDGDGHPDWFVTSVHAPPGVGRCPKPTRNTGCSGNRLYRNLGDGTFEDATDRFGLRAGGWGWGAAIEDLDDDGRLEAVMTNGYLTTDPPWDDFKGDPMVLWTEGADGSWSADGESGLTDTGVGHGLVTFDADDDGDLEVLVARYGDPPVLYRNDRPTSRRWITVRLDDSTRPGNRAGLGSKVRVTPSEGRPTTGWISTGGSYETQRPAELHVGLGDSSVERVEVWWPGESDPQVIERPDSSQVLVVRR